MRKDAWSILCLSAGISIFAAGCGKEQTPPPQPVTVQEEPVNEKQEVLEEEPVPAENTHEGQLQSPLTGEWVEEELALQRPLTCMIGNTTSALPQYGVGQAQIIYEAPVEGGLTRLMGVFEDYKDLKQLGSVRSSRLYFAYYSMEFDAIYLHYGQASYALSFLQSGQIDDLNGLEYEVDQAVIYRDTSKKAPHNAYATGEGIVKGIALKAYDTTCEPTPHYQFAEDESPVELNDSTCQEAGIVRPGYQANKPEFVYDPSDGLYYRYQYGDKHIDGTTGEQLSVRNIILQFQPVKVLDDNGYLEIATTGEGSGLYVTGGKAIAITWKRADVFSPTAYYDIEGNELVLNQGRTWVCVVDAAHPERVHCYKDAAAISQ